MKKIYFGTNLKMYKNIQDTCSYLEKLQKLTADLDREKYTLFVIPSFTSLDRAVQQTNQNLIMLGAQNVCWEEYGQFTGEISPVMLQELGIRICEIGHSERRHVFGEKNTELNKKVLAAVKHGFTALLCIGETEEEKEAGISDEILSIQLKTGLKGLSLEEVKSIWIAYEPVWAIGVNGKPATSDWAEEKHTVIRKVLVELFGECGSEIPVLYGGSVNPQNACGMMQQEHVDGIFVGRSAWDADRFNELIRDVIRDQNKN